MERKGRLKGSIFGRNNKCWRAKKGLRIGKEENFWKGMRERKRFKVKESRKWRGKCTVFGVKNRKEGRKRFNGREQWSILEGTKM